MNAAQETQARLGPCGVGDRWGEGEEGPRGVHVAGTYQST